MYKTIIALLLAATGLQAQTDTLPVKTWPNLVRVHVPKGAKNHRIPFDGDGTRVVLNGKVVKVRFANVDAPEIETSFWNSADSTQPYALQSRDFLASLIAEKDILIDTLPYGGIKAKWSYDRMVVDAYLPDSTNLNVLLVREGACWHSNARKKHKDTHIDGALAAAFVLAKKEKKGLWGLKGYKVSPSFWKSDNKKKPKE